jgi:SAM-dependent methyltransferase
VSDVGVSGADLYRALQQFKTDDLCAIGAFLNAEHRRQAPGGRRLALVDLCSGIGRTLHLYDPGRWEVTCVDADPAALALVAARSPGARVIRADLSAPCGLPPADVIVCAHNAANETGDLDALMVTAARCLRAGGSMWIDVLTAGVPYPYAGYREAVRALDVAGCRYLLETTVVPTADPSRHHLLLHGLPLRGDRACETADASAELLHVLPRRVFTAQEVQAAARRSALRVRAADRGRFEIEKPTRG